MGTLFLLMGKLWVAGLLWGFVTFLAIFVLIALVGGFTGDVN